MDAITNISFEALQRYFHSLSVLGYRSYIDVNKMLFLLYIEEILTGEMAFYITEENLRTISGALNCLYGSTCLIDYPCIPNDDGIIHSIKRNIIPRITEDCILRISEDDIVRVKE